jgi:hypothetical protein
LQCARGAKISTRLSTLSPDECQLLVRHAYLLCDLSLRCYLNPALAAPAGFPDIRGLM